jgi:hypothetical protein
MWPEYPLLLEFSRAWGTMWLYASATSSRFSSLFLWNAVSAHYTDRGPECVVRAAFQYAPGNVPQESTRKVTATLLWSEFAAIDYFDHRAPFAMTKFTDRVIMTRHIGKTFFQWGRTLSLHDIDESLPNILAMAEKWKSCSKQSQNFQGDHHHYAFGFKHNDDMEIPYFLLCSPAKVYDMIADTRFKTLSSHNNSVCLIDYG